LGPAGRYISCRALHSRQETAKAVYCRLFPGPGVVCHRASVRGVPGVSVQVDLHEHL
jgi:hypothetical protein